MKENPFVSVIIPCLNEEDYIGDCLDSIINNNYPLERLEILVVDGLSGDNTRSIVREYAEKYLEIKLLDNPKKITPVAFNKGIQRSKGEVIILVGAHAKYPKDYISMCVEHLRETGADNVGGVLEVETREGDLFGRALAAALRSPFYAGNAKFRTGKLKQPQEVDTVFGGCYSREVFDEIGFFNEDLVHSQDIEFNKRLKKNGGKILLCPDIKAKYFVRSSFISFIRWTITNGVWAIYPLKFTDHIPVGLRHFVPLTFVFSLLVSFSLSLLSTFFATMGMIILTLYTVLNVIFSFKSALSKGSLKLLFWLPLIFLTFHLGYGIGSFWGLIKLTLPNKWASRRG